MSFSEGSFGGVETMEIEEVIDRADLVKSITRSQEQLSILQHEKEKIEQKIKEEEENIRDTKAKIASLN